MIFRMGVGLKWRKWMQFCIIITSFAVLINGDPSNFFNASRDLRQDDPLSPRLFTMIMEGLLKRTYEMQLIRGVSVGKRENTIEVSHLFFADDTLIFCQPDLKSILHLRCVLCTFKLFRNSRLIYTNLNWQELVTVRKLGLMLRSWGAKR